MPLLGKNYKVTRKIDGEVAEGAAEKPKKKLKGVKKADKEVNEEHDENEEVEVKDKKEAASSSKKKSGGESEAAGASKKKSGGAAGESDALHGARPLKDCEGLSKGTREALKGRGITSLFEVQHRAFPHIFEGKDTVGRAKTGCGKTLAFVLPVIERLVANGLRGEGRGRKPAMLAMAPTRELARQIFTEVSFIAKVHSLCASCFYGGVPFGPQCDEIRAGLDALVATPGRLLDHLKRGTLSLEGVESIVLDEADEMLSMGFQEDVEAVLEKVPKGAQKLLFSATMPQWVQSLISKHLQKTHEVVDVVGEGANNQANANITHQCISCSPVQRGDTLADLCKAHAGTFGKTLVFTETKKECDELGTHPTLVQMGAGLLHGDVPQKMREVTMDNFRQGKIKLLIATDVAARGLDVPNVDLVVMTKPPKDLDTYVHRAGRTARAGRTGTCVMFYTRNEEYMVRLLQKKKGIPIKRRGPPQPCEVVAQAARDAVRQIDQIHQDNVDAFAKVAEELLQERGEAKFLLAAALASMAGYTSRIKTRSLHTSYEGAVAILLESEREIETTSKAWYLVRQNLPEEVSAAAKAMSLVQGRHAAIFDCPQENVQAILDAVPWNGIKFSVAKELPTLESRGDERDDWKVHQEKQKWLREKITASRAKRSEENGAGGQGRGTKRKLDAVDSGRGGRGGRGGGRGRF